MQFQRVLVGVDFSASSLAAVRWAARSVAPDAEFILVHVLRDGGVPSWLRSGASGLDALHEEVSTSLLGALRGLTQTVGLQQWEVAIRSGLPSTQLAAAAEEFDADLIVVGDARSRRGSARFGATTAHRILTRTARPVLIVRGDAADAIDNVLVAVDDDAVAAELVEHAQRLARRFEARLHAMHVLSPETIASLEALQRSASLSRDAGGAPSRASVHPDSGPIARSHAWLASLVQHAGAGNRPAETHVGSGDPGPEIVAVASAERANLVVVGGNDAEPVLRAGAQPKRHHLGSTARYVIWAAPCPTLVLPERWSDERSTPVLRATDAAALFRD